MGWCWSKNSARPTVALLAAAFAQACATGLPEPVHPIPALAGLSVFVEPPDVATETEACRSLAISNNFASALRKAIADDLTKAGMNVVQLETARPDLRASARLVISRCWSRGRDDYRWDHEADLFVHDGKYVVWHERNVGTIHSNANVFVGTVATRLVGPSVKSPALSVFAQTPRAAGSSVVGSQPTGPYVEAPVDRARADTLFREGRQLAEDGKLAQACNKFGESLGFDPTPGTLMNLADCEEQLGRLASAWTHWRQLLRALPQTGDPRRDHAQRRLDDVESRLPSLAIRGAPGMPSGARVLLDDFPIGDRSVGRSLLVGPGDHVVTVEAPRRDARKYPVSLREREKRELIVEPGGEKATPAPSGAPAPEGHPIGRPDDLR
jgi:hypothetical protein